MNAFFYIICSWKGDLTKAVKGYCTSCFSSNISKFLQSSKDYDVLGDGHCLVYSWEVALRASNTTDFKPPYEALLCLIDMEVKRNKDKHSSFFGFLQISTKMSKNICWRRNTHPRLEI